jgi:hypothetical protein
MPSKALQRWQTSQSTKLDQIETVHKTVSSTRPGGHYLTVIDHAYVVMLAAQWQDFCRHLHSETADAVARAIDRQELRFTVRAALTVSRSMDRGNAGPGVIGADFGRFGEVPFWELVERMDKRNVKRRLRLAQLHMWRNGVAHQDFAWNQEQARIIKNTSGTLDDVRIWRGACDALAIQFDKAVAVQATRLIGVAPW